MKYLPGVLEGAGASAIVLGAYLISPVLALMTGGAGLIVGAAMLEMKNGRRPE